MSWYEVLCLDLFDLREGIPGPRSQRNQLFLRTCSRVLVYEVRYLYVCVFVNITYAGIDFTAFPRSVPIFLFSSLGTLGGHALS